MRSRPRARGDEHCDHWHGKRQRRFYVFVIGFRPKCPIFRILCTLLQPRNKLGRRIARTRTCEIPCYGFVVARRCWWVHFVGYGAHKRHCITQVRCNAVQASRCWCRMGGMTSYGQILDKYLTLVQYLSNFCKRFVQVQYLSKFWCKCQKFVNICQHLPTFHLKKRSFLSNIS